MSQPLQSLLPARRRQCTGSKLNPPYSSDSQSWTAARCHRLLRPIISRIELLRKDRSVGVGNSVFIQDPEAAWGAKHAKDKAKSRDDDACWARGRKRVRKTYSARCKLQDGLRSDRIPGTLSAFGKGNHGQKASLQPGEFLVPTPILNRSRVLVEISGQDLARNLPSTAPPKAKIFGRPQSRYASKDGEPHFELNEIMRRIRKTTNAARYKIYEGIYNSLEALFKATMPYDGLVQLPTHGVRYSHENGLNLGSKIPRSKSLLSMCLRGVPKYIKREGKRAAVEAEEMGHRSAFDTCDISTDTYTDLESFGTAEMGWKHLKTVVRTHGVQTISDAIREGFLDPYFASALVVLCAHTSAPDDAETILTSLLTSIRYPNPKSIHSHIRDDSTFLPLCTLEKFIKYTERACYHHRQLKNLITSGLLSVTWLGTKCFSSVWTSVFRSLSNDPSNSDATTFMTSILPLLCTARSSSIEKQEDTSLNQSSMPLVLDNTLESVLTTLSAMSMLSSSHKRIISHILRSTIIDCQMVSSHLDSHGVALVVMSNLLASVEAEEEESLVRQLVKSLTEKCHQSLNSQGLKDRITNFVCSVARCCGRGSSGNGFEYLKIILRRLIAFTDLDNLEESQSLKDIIVDSAFAFQGHVPDEEHVKYAQHIRTQLNGHISQSKASPSISRADSESGFRWEEGINEWVVATPALKLRGAQEIILFSSDDDSDFETPIRQGMKRRKRPTAPHTKDKVCSYRVSDFAPSSPSGLGEDVSGLTRKDHQTHDKALPTYCLSQDSVILTKPRSGGRPTSKLQRLGCDPLCSRQRWKIFEHSDDELYSTSSDSAQLVLLELLNSKKSSSNKQQGTFSILDKPPARLGTRVQEHSEDELGV